MTALWIVNLLVPTIDAVIIILLVQLVFSIAFGATANRMAAKNYLEHGWEFADPNSLSATKARAKWGLGLPLAPSN